MPDQPDQQNTPDSPNPNTPNTPDEPMSDQSHPSDQHNPNTPSHPNTSDEPHNKTQPQPNQSNQSNPSPPDNQQHPDLSDTIPHKYLPEPFPESDYSTSPDLESLFQTHDIPYSPETLPSNLSEIPHLFNTSKPFDLFAFPQQPFVHTPFSRMMYPTSSSVISLEASVEAYTQRSSSLADEYCLFIKRLASITNELLQQVFMQRTKLGLSLPDPFKTRFEWQRTDSPAAAGYKTHTLTGEFETYLTLNIPELVMPFLNETTCHQLRCVKDYIVEMRELTGCPLQTLIQSLDTGVEWIFDHAENLLRNNSHFSPYLFILEKDGIEYHNRKHLLIARAKPITRYLCTMIPQIEEALCDIDLFSDLHHEVDHLSFYKSKLWKNHITQSALTNNLKIHLSSPGNIELYLNTLEESILSELWMTPLCEARAWFFNYIKPFQMKTHAAEIVATLVRSSVGNYAFRHVFFPDLVQLYHLKGELTTPMTDQLLRAYHQNPQAVLTIVGNVYLKNQRMPDEFSEKITEYQMKMIEHTRHIVPIIAKAYTQDPSRFKIADQCATTLEEYLDICEGNRVLYQ